jgi:hypothetical protein
MARKTSDKWRFAIGTTSRVPGLHLCDHYLIFDFDNRTLPEIFQSISLLNDEVTFRWVAQPTESGWHVYTDLWCTFKTALEMAKKAGADPAWLRIGEKRGYLFLADKAPVPLPWPVERMVIARDVAKNRSNRA